jgi:CPA1 family monovalent cation:H+ antiporter
MTLFETISILIVLAAIFSYLNHRFLRLPTTIGLLSMALVVSLLLLWLGRGSSQVYEFAQSLLASIDFNRTLIHGMLGFLLFAGALSVNLDDLRRQMGIIALLSTGGVLLSTLIVGTTSWILLNRVLDLPVSFSYCLLFGALISPTDPIAVLAILKPLGVPKTLETKIAGESLFNDGVGVVLFLAIAGIIGFGGSDVHVATATGEAAFQAQDVARLFVVEAGGGGLLGFLLGFIAYRMLRSVDNYQVEILISLALVAGGYALCGRLHVSGPIAMVVAGLLIGNHGRLYAMSETTREHLDTFWELIDEILNAVLFLLIGLEVLVLTYTPNLFVASLLTIPVVLLARFAAVGSFLNLLRLRRSFTPHAVKLLTWGGLRGGISVALALSIPRVLAGHAVPEREILLSITYSVVIFSIIVQGLSMGPLTRRLLRPREDRI